MYVYINRYISCTYVLITDLLIYLLNYTNIHRSQTIPILRLNYQGVKKFKIYTRPM